jgi:hypothetical protein
VGRTAFDLHLRTVDDARRYLRGVNDPRLSALLDDEAPAALPDGENGRRRTVPSSPTAE